MNPASFDQLIPMTKELMTKAIEHMQHEFGTLRTGKASPALVDNITVDAYGSTMRLKDVAAITTPDTRTLMIQPWDISILSAVERAIMASSLGITPNNDGKVLRLPMPDLSEERRKKLTKEAKDFAEQARVAIRSVRRDSNEAAKKMQKDSVITEDDLKHALDQIQKATDELIGKVDKLYGDKEKDLLTI